MTIYGHARVHCTDTTDSLGTPVGHDRQHGARKCAESATELALQHA